MGAGNKQILAIQNGYSALKELPADTEITFYDGGSVKAGNLIPYSFDSNGNMWCFVLGERPETEVGLLRFDYEKTIRQAADVCRLA